MKLIIVALCLAILTPSVVSGEKFYKWVDKDGVVHMTDNPVTIPPEYQKDVEEFGDVEKSGKKEEQKNVETFSYFSRPPENGLFKRYYSDGVLAEEANYRNGRLEGLRKEYNTFGNLSEEANYKNGTLEGTRKVYVGNKLFIEEDYKNGQLEEIRKEYYPRSGNLYIEENYKGGKREGTTKSYYESGELRVKETWQEGKMINREEYNKDGTIKANLDYK